MARKKSKEVEEPQFHFNLLSGEIEAEVIEEDEVEPKKYKVDLFSVLNSISTKDYSFTEEMNDGYQPFIINKGLMQHIDTILYANEMNINHQVTKEMHYDYLYYSVSKKKRYGKWAKASTDDKELIDDIVEYYKINRNYAEVYMRMVGRDRMIEHLKNKMNQGGRLK